jgi:anti-sigma factor RsiW
MNRTHLSDARLIELTLAGGDCASEPHLAECERCESRAATLIAMMDEVDASLASQVDEAFPPERLARQQARILQQLEHEGRPARVIAFPAASAVPVPLHRRTAPRWVAAAGAIAASFVVGILTDHLTYDLPRSRPVATTHLAVRSVDQNAPVRTVAASLSDDELLGQIEAAVGSSGPASLRALDAMTPRAWDDR